MDEVRSAEREDTEQLGNTEGVSIAEPALEEYFYAPLQANEIRLLEILPGDAEDPIWCRFHIVSLDEDEQAPYGALSYTWDSVRTDEQVLIDGKFISVTSNLEAALFEFRRQAPELAPLSSLGRLKLVSEELERLTVLFDDNPQRNDVSKMELGGLKELLRELNESLLGVVDDHDATESLVNAIILKAERNWNRIAIREDLPRFNQTRRYLWIDALCINQKDFMERADQVRLMARVYLKASLLVIWLGKGLNEDMEAYHSASHMFDRVIRKRIAAERQGVTFSLNKMGQNLVNDELDDAAVRATTTSAIMKMLQHPYFARAWIRQEYALGTYGCREKDNAGYILTCCGTARFREFLPISISMLLITATNVPSNGIKDDEGVSFMRGPYNAILLFKARLQYQKYADQTPLANSVSTRSMLFKLVAETAGMLQATDPRDLIYSVLGLVETCFYKDWRPFDPSALVIDYKAPLSVVYSSFIQEIVNCTRRLDMLAFCQRIHLGQSWSPDWSSFSFGRAGVLTRFIRTASYTFFEGLPFNATPGTLCDAEFDDDENTLTVSGFIWDTVMTKLAQLQNDEDFYEDLKILCENLLNEPRSESDITAEATRDELIELLTLNWSNSQEYLSAFQDWINTEDDSDSSTIDMEAAFLAAISHEGGDGLLMAENGSVFRAPFDTVEDGDLVCVILGCATPILLCPAVDGDYYTVGGEVYVPGIMNGIAMDHLRDGRKELQRFVLR